MILLKSLASPVMHLCLGPLAGWVPGPPVALFQWEARKFTHLGWKDALLFGRWTIGWGDTGQCHREAMLPITSLIVASPWLTRFVKGGGARIRVKHPLSCRVSGFGGCACGGFGVRSEGTRFHLGASRRHGSQKEPDEREAQDSQA